MSRPSLPEWAMAVARVSASRSTCLRLRVGCVLLDRRGRLLTANYNGAAAGEDHCTEATCNDELGTCDAIHAEQNALLQCADVQKIQVAYVTIAPCFNCTKLLLNTGCTVIVYDEEHPSQPSDRARALWEKAGRSFVSLAELCGRPRCSLT